MASYNPPEKNAEYICYITLYAQSDGEPLSSATIAAGDFRVTTDGNAFTDLDTTPSVAPAAGYAVKVTVSATEMNGDNILIYWKDASGAEWYGGWMLIQTVAAGQQFDDLSTLTAAQVNTEADTALTDYDPPTKTELDTAMAALNDPTAAAIRAEIDSNSTQLAAIVADTNELQTDDVPSLIAGLVSAPTAAQIVAALLNTADSSYITADTIGRAIYDIMNNVASGAVAGTAAGTLSATVDITTHATFTETISGIGDLTDATNIIFMIKASASDADSAALVHITYDVGLERIEGAAPAAAGNGAITILAAAAGDISLRIEAIETANLTARTGVLSIDKITATSKVPMQVGTATITAGIVQELS